MMKKKTMPAIIMTAAMMVILIMRDADDSGLSDGLMIVMIGLRMIRVLMVTMAVLAEAINSTRFIAAHRGASQCIAADRSGS